MSQTLWSWLVRRAPLASSNHHPKGRFGKERRPLLEQLESRDLPSVFHPTLVLVPHGNGGGSSLRPFGSPGPTGTTPQQIRHAYGFDQITFNGTAGDGSGTTIAIVDAFNQPNIVSDLHGFDTAFGLPDPVLTRMNENGGSSLPQNDVGWGQEISLDVEWAHAIAPKANILLVEANAPTDTDLFAAVRTAAMQPGVVAVSMSWGGGEFGGETGLDGSMVTPTGHAGVTFVASSGDTGAPTSYPSASPNVLSVGGTTTNLDSAGNILSESGWSGSGGGVSAVEAQPAYQHGVVTQSSTARADPDVSYDADPNTGFGVFDTFGNSGGPWLQFGGTSDAAPQWAALIAIADQGRIKAGLGALDGPTQTLPKLYGLPASDFNDITTGGSTGNPPLNAGPGYDLVTGRGTPIANKIVADLIGSVAPAATHFSVSAPSTSTAGASFSVTVTALDANNNPFPGYSGTVHFTSSDGQAVLPGNSTLTNGTATFTVTLKTAGSDSITATDTSNSSITGSATVNVSPAAASSIGFGQQPTNTNAGAVISPAVTVRVFDAYGNVATNDNTDTVSVAIGTNPASGTLSGTSSVRVSGGTATFGNLSINNVGTGYTLRATLGSFSATSSSFNILTTGGGGGGGGTATVIENFDASENYWLVSGGGNVNAFLAPWAAHDGPNGLDMANGNDWLYRTDAAAQVKAGDTLSVWVAFAGRANGRAYFGFGASANGTLSLVAAPNTGQLILQQNLGYGFTDLAAVNASYRANHWYRLEVDWGKSGTIVGKLFDSNGTTLLKSVTASTTVITSGGIAFRATGNDKYFDTVTDKRGVNNFVVQVGGSGGKQGMTGASAATTTAQAGLSAPPPVHPPAPGAFARFFAAQRAAEVSELEALFAAFGPHEGPF
jgi:hypothetical protein